MDSTRAHLLFGLIFSLALFSCTEAKRDGPERPAEEKAISSPAPPESSTPIPESSPRVLDHQWLAEKYIIVDLHNDTMSQLLALGDVSAFDGERLSASWPRLKAGGLKAQVFAVWIYRERDLARGEAMIDLFYQVIETHRDEIAGALSFADVQRNVAAGKFSALLAIEGGHVIGHDLSLLEYFYRRGVRYMTLTWKWSNQIADSSEGLKKPHHGLSAFGEEVVKEMNALGMIIDVSHCSDEAVQDVLALSQDPVIASHSNCSALHPHPRNLNDELIKGICAQGGVIGINFHKPFLTGQRRATVADVADHLDHVVQIGGIECAALGSDFDGNIIPPAELKDMASLPNLTRELIRRGYTEEDIGRICGGNFLRVLKRVVDD